MNLPAILSLAAAVLAAAVALAYLAKGKRREQQLTLAAAGAILAAAHIAQGLLLSSQTPPAALSAFKALLSLLVFFPAAAIPFFSVFARKRERPYASNRLAGFIVLGAVLLAMSLVLPPERIVKMIHFAGDGAFWGLTFSGYGKGIGILLLVANVLCLYLVENTYRAANIPGKVTLKYPLLGILSSSVINVLVISRMLAIASIEVHFFAIEACGVIILCATFLYATVRYHPFDVDAGIDRESVPSAVTIIVSGIYLVSLGSITLLARLTGMPYDRFTLSVLGIFVAFLLAAVLISGRARRRLRRFINENFYATRYNYRREWRHYSRLMASSQTIDDFLTNFTTSLCETMIVRRGLFWVDVKGGRTATYGFQGDPPDTEQLAAMFEHSAGRRVVMLERPLQLPSTQPVSTSTSNTEAYGWQWVRATAAVGHGDDFRGIIALSEKHLNAPYTDEDRDFLATIADQATLTMENLLMAEKTFESRQMETFSRFASFVIHDLKNTVGMLSLIADNAKDNLGNVEFQRDAIETITRSVEKMKGIINSLSANELTVSIAKTEADIAAVARKSIESLAQTALTKEIEVTFDCTGEIVAEVDPRALKRIIENLTLNAIEATPRGKAVHVEVTALEKERIGIRVTDSGAGFDEEYLSRHLFRPFYSTKREGLGIGLVQCKSLVEAHGGTISIRNGPGGATVTVELPR